MKFTKKCDSTQHKINISNRRRSSAGMFYTSSAGAVTSLILMLALPFIFGFTGATNLLGLGGSAHATTSTLTISVTDSVSLDMASSIDTGNFAHSDTSTNNVSIITNNGTGYILGIKAKTNNSNALINSDDTSKTIPSITTSISESTYASSSTYNNTWGFRPSKLNSAVNENYIQAPTSSSTLTTLDQTSSANPSTANNYNLAIGSRINSSTVPGSYSNVFVLTVTANPIPYTITYNKNTTDTVTNMPANTSSQTYDETVNISDQVPARDGFNFKGWCTTQTADGGTCTGTTYNPDGGGTDLTWTLDQTISSNSLTIYAMWEQAITLQDMTFADCPTDTAKSISDARDGESYKVQVLADGNCWMLDNLRLDLTNSTILNNLTTSNTHVDSASLTSLKSGNRSAGAQYASSGFVTWAQGDTVNSYNQAKANADYKDTTTTSYGAGSGKIGVYYNYCAASAGSYCYDENAGTGNASYDICPAGWRMPTGGNYQGSGVGDGEYFALGTALGLTIDKDWEAFTDTTYQTTLSTPLSGTFYSGWASGQDAEGSFWSSTYSTDRFMRRLTLDSRRVYPFYHHLRYYGNSVRCVKTPPLYDLVAKQSKGTMASNNIGINDTIVAPTAETPISSNSGVFTYNGSHSDAASTSTIYFYRGILDTYGNTGTYGSDGLSDAYPNYVVLSSASNKGSLTTSNTCWRIVRTTGSGGVKMIYNGKWTGSTCANSSSSANAVSAVYFNRGNASTQGSDHYGTKGFVTYVGYNYNSTYAYNNTSYTSAVANSTLFNNGTASNLRTQLESWYSSNMTSYTSKLETSASWCNDRTTYTSTSATATATTSTIPYKTSSAAVYFGAYHRLVTANASPTLQCPNTTGNDLLTTSKGMTYPAAPLTADEAALAGSGYYGKEAYHDNSYLRSGGVFWLLSPYNRASSGAVYESVLNSGGGLSSSYVYHPDGVRPAISLTSGTTPASGTGTATDPWIVNP